VDCVVDHVCFVYVSKWLDGEGGGEGVPAVLRRRMGPPSTTFPSAFTRIKSEAFSSGQATPKGFTQKEVGSTGSWGLVVSYDGVVASQILSFMLKVYPRTRDHLSMYKDKRKENLPSK
jgi:hypothetical protein